MSLFIHQEVSEAHDKVRQPTSRTDWILLGPAQDGGLKLQSEGAGGLEEIEEEFHDGRIQFAFVRVKDPNTQLPKLVQINWCGESVPEFKKGGFHSQLNQLTQLLSGAHVTVNARSQEDLDPDVILKKVSDSSGSKFSINQSAPALSERPVAPAPVGTAYKPIGTPDIAAMRSNVSKPEAPAPVGTAYTPPRNELANIRQIPPVPQQAPAPVSVPPPAPAQPSIPTPPTQAPKPPSGSLFGGVVGKAGDWSVPKSSPVNTARVAAPAAVPAPPAPPAPVAPTPAAPVTTAQSEPEERPGKVGTAYEPVKLPAPKKLGNRFPFAQGTETSAPPAPSSFGGAAPPKKLTWSERQEQARKQAEEEEERSGDALSNASAFQNSAPAATQPPPMPTSTRPTPVVDNSAPPPPPPPMPSRPDAQPETRAVPPPPAPPAPPAPPMPQSSYTAHSGLGQSPSQEALIQSEMEKLQVEDETSIPPPPPAPPAPPMPVAPAAPAAPVAPPAPPAPAQPQSKGGQRAKVVYEYEATEDNEMDLIEDEVIHDIEQIDEGWWSGKARNGREGLFPANYVELIEEEETQEAPASASIPPPPPPPPMPARSTSADQGKTAIAEYDYEAGEDNEISFAEGDTITHIDFVSDDWYEGTSKAGKRGLFPANYVVMN